MPSVVLVASAKAVQPTGLVPRTSFGLATLSCRRWRCSLERIRLTPGCRTRSTTGPLKCSLRNSRRFRQGFGNFRRELECLRQGYRVRNCGVGDCSATVRNFLGRPRCRRGCWGICSIIEGGNAALDRQHLRCAVRSRRSCLPRPHIRDVIGLTLYNGRDPLEGAYNSPKTRRPSLFIWWGAGNISGRADSRSVRVTNAGGHRGIRAYQDR